MINDVLSGYMRGESEDDSLKRIAQHHPNIWSDVETAGRKDAESGGTGFAKSARQKGLNAFNAAMKKNGRTGAGVTLEDVMMNGAKQGPAPEGPQRHKPMAGIKEFIELASQYDEGFNPMLDKILDKFNRAHPNHKNVAKRWR